MSNDTPRTDAAEIMIQLGMRETGTGTVSKSACAELERELAALRERLAEAGRLLAARDTEWRVEMNRAMQAEQRAERAEQDAERYRFLRAETDRVDPVAAVSWKWKMNRESSEWANTSCAKSLDELCDGQIAARSAT